MRVAYHFDDAAWAIGPVRRTVETLASLHETPFRICAPGTSEASGEALVHVGAVGTCPTHAAASIEVDGWPAWQAHTLERIVVVGEPVACPPGTATSAADVARFPAAWLRAAAFSLSREEELQDRRRDQWECYSGAYTRLGAIGLLERPFINHLARSLERRLEAHAASRGESLEHIPRWKDGARFAVALTHDVDDVTLRSLPCAWRLLRQARSPASYAFRGGLTAMARALTQPPGAHDPYWSFERWMGEEERRGFRSSFFICSPAPTRRHEYDALYSLDDPLQYEGRRVRVMGLLREMRRRGHEVGLHGSYMSFRSASELERQRTQIEHALGAPVVGTRQHFLRFEIGATWTAQAAAGIGYDTTLGYNEALGFRAGIAAPFRPFDPSTGQSYGPWQLPLTAMDGTLFRTLKLDEDAAVSAVSRHLGAVEAVGGLAVLLWHPNAADERSFPGWWRTYLRVLDELACRGAWVTSAGELSQWWAERLGRMSPPRP